MEDKVQKARELYDELVAENTNTQAQHNKPSYQMLSTEAKKRNYDALCQAIYDVMYAVSEQYKELGAVEQRAKELREKLDENNRLKSMLIYKQNLFLNNIT